MSCVVRPVAASEMIIFAPTSAAVRTAEHATDSAPDMPNVASVAPRSAAASASHGTIASASTQHAAMCSTASFGNLPPAVSPESITW